MPINYKDYPENWKQISAEIKKRGNDKCELCYAPNGVDVYRLDNKHNFPWYIASVEVPGYKKIKIILTVHHIDGDKNNNDPLNLISLCQRCHLRLDLFKHVRKRKLSRAKK